MASLKAEDPLPPISFCNRCSSLWIRIVAMCRKQLLSRPWEVSIALMMLFTLVSFAPLIYYYKGYDQEFLDKHHEFNIFFSQNYSLGLLVTLLIIVPMVIELCLDYRHIDVSDIDFNQWLARFLFICSLIFPNLALLVIIRLDSSSLNPLVPQIQLSLFVSQQVTIVGSFFCTLFGQNFSSVSNPSNKLTISVEERTVYFLLTFLLAKIFLVWSMCTGGSALLMGAGLLTNAIGLLQLVILLTYGLSFLAKQTVDFQFQSHGHMSAFYHLLVVLLFSLFNIMLLVLSNRYGGIDPHGPSRHTRLRNDFAMEFLYVQVGLTYFLTVIPGRAYMLSAKLKQEKLNIRLNLIRYVSHEMRTPLNTAFLGLGVLNDELEKINSRITHLLQKFAKIHSSISMDTEHQLRRPSELSDPSGESLSSKLQNRFTGDAFNNVMESHHKRDSLQIHALHLTQPHHLVELLEKVATMSEVVDMQDTVRQVQDSCRVALETLNDLLTFDKLDEKKLIVEVEHIDPWQLLFQTARPFEINAKESNIEFSITCDDPESHWTESNYIKGDRFKLSQVIRNLISNALKFTPCHGTVQVKLQKQSGSMNDNRVLISVVDSGAGISSQNQKKLFGQYVQFNAAALQQGKGSGLGLWIAKSIVEMHGGTIQGVSPGESLGSTFSIDLPLYSKYSPSMESKPAAVSQPNNTISSILSAFGLISLSWSSSGLSERSLLDHSVVMHDATDKDDENPVSRVDSSESTNEASQLPRIFHALSSKSVIAWNSATAPLVERLVLNPSTPSQKSDDVKKVSFLPELSDSSVSSKSNGPVEFIMRQAQSISNIFRSYVNHDQSERDLESNTPIQRSPSKCKTVPVYSVNNGWGGDNKVLPVGDAIDVETPNAYNDDIPSDECELLCEDSLKVAATMVLSDTAVKTWESGLTFLLVDDALPNRKMLRKVLTNYGHTVYECGDGTECVELLGYSNNSISRLPPVDVVLMDEHMPKMNGPEATKILKSHGFEGIIYAVTGTVAGEDGATEFLLNGAKAVFCKPLNIDALRNDLKSIFCIK